MQELLKAYNLEAIDIIPLHQGLINETYIVKTEQQDNIVQSINTNIFKQPEIIDQNIRAIGTFINQTAPDYIFTHLIENTKGETLTLFNKKHYRVFKKIEGVSYDVLSNEKQVFEAANAFGSFTAVLNDFKVNQLGITLPDFHNLSLRYQQFEKAIINGNNEKLDIAKDAVSYLKSESHLVETYELFINHPETHQRVTHHDTKISNVLFDNEDKAIGVIDLDTVMPGYFISDIGDMCRTYLCAYSEEEKDVNKVSVITERFNAIQNGYLQNMGSLLTNIEKDHFVFSGQYLIYMQALRFLTDYLNNDIYYGSKYEGHNLVRALNQIQLLKSYNDTIV